MAWKEARAGLGQGYNSEGGREMKPFDDHTVSFSHF